MFTQHLPIMANVRFHTSDLHAPQHFILISVTCLAAIATPHVAAYKHSENGDENDKVQLTCVSHGYPLPNDWSWFKIAADGTQMVSLSTNPFMGPSE